MPVLSLQNLRKSYRSPAGESTMVVNVGALTLAAGQQLALRGVSGSGKTTFLNLIAGILRADSGSVVIADTDMMALSESQRDRLRASSIGYVFQTFNLLQGYTALDNVKLGMAFGPGGADRARAQALLERVGLGDRLHYRPRQLSTGQQQRVAVARALANRPKLVLADEPTGNLDPRTAGEVLRLIRDVCAENDAALLLVSHDDDVLAQFDHVQDFGALNGAGWEVAL
ncbi:ABC transporter ATP-binding protein [Synoicihabitans lomoniglobus]|uniref:ABC transporter ATP-binding protein n=1 Tax=Synoicihabitans lomoniglobus TaxID=2909285 RepID=A0AAE9ZYK4_9BACT|nr:ABC transporter ATP-binding protein [Opitutaceae bacterium LMO-M01]WED64973.1 ABC transporter ATP-binding protein [Opitutaceae bacterium LMO-M01]